MQGLKFKRERERENLNKANGGKFNDYFFPFYGELWSCNLEFPFQFGKYNL